MSLVFILLLSFVSSWVLTGAYRALALKAKLFDLPVSRSAHSIPVPVGGGVVLSSLFLLAVFILFAMGSLALGQFMALSASLIIAAVGFVDDIKELNILWRIIPHIFCAVWTIWWLGGIPDIHFLGWTLEQGLILNLLGVVAIVWLVNLYNFMDGIDGLAATELVFVNVMSLIFVINNTNSSFFYLSIVSIGSCLGFLVWNWSPAKIFMGDVGSGFIGFMLAAMAIISLQMQVMTVWTWLVLLAVFVVDATVTLIRRLLAGEKWYQGHASHAYQKSAKHFNSHQKVTITVLLINVFWLAPLAWMTILYPELGMVWAALAVVPLVGLALNRQAGKPDLVLKSPEGTS